MHASEVGAGMAFTAAILSMFPPSFGSTPRHLTAGRFPGGRSRSWCLREHGHPDGAVGSDLDREAGEPRWFARVGPGGIHDAGSQDG